ncbi:MAG: hypothetical protein HY888_02365 [Deltaproteobacteria bacterium]|nr:hypothetical protein [Deltaproteobacteria bacterium]
MGEAADKEKELSDIELCYKAMGLSFSDNPEQVEKTYRKLKDEYTRGMRSSDQAERTAATENLKQLEELFTTITGSMIYKDYAREYEKYKEIKASEMSERQKKKAEQAAVKEELVKCPYCHKLIAPKLKVCLYCRGKILTPMEKLMEQMFSTKYLVVAGIFVLLVVAAVVLSLNPDLLKR